MARKMTRNRQLAARLYRVMPGAPTPSMEGGYYLWEEVGNEHMDFCEAIAAELLALRELIEGGSNAS